MALPAWITRTVFHPLWAKKDGSRVREHMVQAEDSQYLSAGELERLQWKRLKALLEHAQDHVPYYRDLFRDLDARAADIQCWSDFAKLPVLTKSKLQKEKERFKSESLPEGGDSLEVNRTGGSTGEPLTFYTTKSRGAIREATTIRHNRWTGWDLGEPMAVIWGAAQDVKGMVGLKARLRHALLEKHLILNAMEMDAVRMRAFASRLQIERPQTWLVYANSCALFVRFLREHKITGLSPNAVITSAEMLTPESRSLIEQTLGCQVYDRYGCREVSVIASECGRRADHAMHIAADILRIEVTGPAGRPGKVLVTDLANYGTPFIRYQIEDVSSLVGGDCSCGRSLPLLAPVVGRTSDFLVTADGRIVAGTALTILLLAQLSGISRGQLVQHERGKIIFRMVPDGVPSAETVRKLRAACREALGKATKVEVEIVDEIPLTQSGKFPFAISNVDPFDVLQ